MKRVVILSTFLSPHRGGAEACVEEISQRLSDTYDVTIVTVRWNPQLPREERRGRVLIRRLGRGSRSDKWLFPPLAALAVRRLRPDLVHAVLESYAGLAMILVRFLSPRTPRLLTLQSTNTSLFLRPMHAAASRVTAISRVLAERAKAFGCSDVEIIPNGVPVGAIRALAVPKIPGRVLFAGRLEPVKGVDVLLRAFSMLASGSAASATLCVAGDGSQRHALERQAAALGIAERVRFAGYLTGEALLREYAEAQVFCGLSRSEAFGNVFLESQAAGCAVVATNVGGIPEIVLDGQTGLLVPPEDPAAAAAAMRRLLDDEPLRSRLTAAGAAHAAQFDWDVVARRYGAVYASLL